MAVALAATVTVVAVAASSPLSHSTSVDARAAQPPTVALFMLLLGTGVVMLGALVLLLWSGRRRKDDPNERTPAALEIPWWLKLVAILLPLALGAAVIAAAISGTRRARSTPIVGGLGLGQGLLESAPAHRPTTGFTLPAWLPWVMLAIVVVAIAVFIVVLVLRSRRSVAIADPDAAGASAAAVQAAIWALDSEADARGAVIAAYGAMQRTLGDHGVARSSVEAPREYLRRVLVASRATQHEARTLTGLFEEARYSSHPIPERVREVALGALRSLQARLRAERVE
jgi:Domain of unknown function (DUF4129)